MEIELGLSNLDIVHWVLPWIMPEKITSYDRSRTRTCNPRIRSPMPYPLGHTTTQILLYWITLFIIVFIAKYIFKPQYITRLLLLLRLPTHQSEGIKIIQTSRLIWQAYMVVLCKWGDDTV